MRCKSFKIHKLSFWFIIAIAIVAANLSASDAEGAAGPRFVVERRGVSDGRSVVFIPDVASAGAVWDAAAAGIIDGHDVHIVTLAGFAGVPAVDPIGPYIERAVGALAAYLDEEGLQDIVLVGHSMGDVAGSDFRPILAKVSAPVTVLAAWSEGAPYSSDQLRAIYEGQYAELTDVDVRVIANSRHFIMLDQPDAFAIALNGVLTGDRGGRD